MAGEHSVLYVKVIGTNFMRDVEHTVAVEAGKVIGFNDQKEPVMVDAGGSSTSVGCIYRGVGSPEGVVTATQAASLYYDEEGNLIYLFTGTAGANTGWVLFG